MQGRVVPPITAREAQLTGAPGVHAIRVRVARRMMGPVAQPTVGRADKCLGHQVAEHMTVLVALLTMAQVVHVTRGLGAPAILVLGEMENSARLSASDAVHRE